MRPPLDFDALDGVMELPPTNDGLPTTRGKTEKLRDSPALDLEATRKLQSTNRPVAAPVTGIIVPLAEQETVLKSPRRRQRQAAFAAMGVVAIVSLVSVAIWSRPPNRPVSDVSHVRDEASLPPSAVHRVVAEERPGVATTIPPGSLEGRGETVASEHANAPQTPAGAKVVDRPSPFGTPSSEVSAAAKRPAPSVGNAATGSSGSSTAGPSSTEELAGPRSLTFPADFALNAIEPSEGGRKKVAAFVRALGRCDGKISVVGHSCGLGTEAARDAVSLGRARWVAAVLEQAGLSGAAMQIQGIGSREPLASDRTLSGRIRNRRVTVSCN